VFFESMFSSARLPVVSECAAGARFGKNKGTQSLIAQVQSCPDQHAKNHWKRRIKEWSANANLAGHKIAPSIEVRGMT
jgi:hypothetical protein